MLERLERLARAHWRGFLVSFAASIAYNIVAAVLEARQTRVSLTGYNYKYEEICPNPELKVIRLIELHPAESEDESIQIYLRTVSLLDPERHRYEAISYCWGDPTVTECIRCGGSVLWITTNLFTALRRFRHKDRSRLLWADAICINQSDNDEKSSQVRMMTDIYRNADHVLIWLGEEEHYSELLDKFVPRLLEAKQRREEARDQRNLLQINRQVRDLYRLPPIADPGYRGLLRITSRPWFRRVWIIQEIATAREGLLCCGEWVMPWESFKEAWVFAVEDLGLGIALSHILGESINSVSRLGWAQYSVSNGLPQPILQLLAYHRDAEATKPEDKIFALAGIATDGGTQIEINYSKSVSQVYRDTALATMMSDQNLDILSLSAYQTGVNDLNLPSWVPDWRTNEVPIPLMLRSVHGASIFEFRATGESKCSPTVSSEGALGLQGYIIDKVAVTGNFAKYRRPRTLFASIWHHWDDAINYGEWDQISEAHSGKTYEPTGESILDVFWQCLLVGLHEHGFEQQRREFEAFDQTYPRQKLVNSLPIPHRWPPFKILYGVISTILSLDLMFNVLRREARDHSFAQKLATIRGRRMIKTKEGFLGMATGDVKVDDSIVLLRGGHVPFVARKMADGSQHHILVGDCYLHGLMHGGAWNPERCEAMWFL
ncbi:HET-domain-containing protein [Lepidopterella palustris CBS 459.81]|uniref:HET-domain-containing protein n=1 Tax=Lepidopterella palustris CBS 459.81 TaxID=1314670 RepID=A0A8E2DZC7_9PEZI|nr:HET-domain-containing protein [Lepidopterella palustris CBS 459.81]